MLSTAVTPQCVIAFPCALCVFVNRAPASFTGITSSNPAIKHNILHWKVPHDVGQKPVYLPQSKMQCLIIKSSCKHIRFKVLFEKRNLRSCNKMTEVSTRCLLLCAANRFIKAVSQCKVKTMWEQHPSPVYCHTCFLLVSTTPSA